jgi:hypothetical protein
MAHNCSIGFFDCAGIVRNRKRFAPFWKVYFSHIKPSLYTSRALWKYCHMMMKKKKIYDNHTQESIRHGHKPAGQGEGKHRDSKEEGQESIGPGIRVW